MKKQSKRAVFYHLMSQKKINGTLFYCFEYFVFLNKYIDTNFYLYNCTEDDLKMIGDIFVDRYNFNHELLDKMIAVNTISELYSIESDKSLFLDTRSFDNIFRFMKTECLVFCNDDFKSVRSSLKDITYYGYYDYQNFDKEQMLQLNFDIFKPLRNNEPTNTAFISSPHNDSKEIVKFLDIDEDKILVKKPFEAHANLFERFDTLYMYHTKMDTNNRAIPEAFFYDKKVKVAYSDPTKIDSVKLRLEDCYDGNLGNYWLTKENLMIKDMLE